MNPSRLRLLRRGLLVLAVVFPLVYVYVQYVAAERDYRATLAAAEAETRKMAAALKEHAARSVGEADRVLRAAMREVEQGGVATTWDNRLALEGILRRYMTELPQISKVTIIDGGGQVLAVSGAELPAPPDVRETGYYKYHHGRRDNSLFMTATYKSRVNGRLVFAITRSLRHKDGSLKAIMLLSMRTDYFAEFYRTLGDGKGVRVMLVGDNGSVLVQSAGDGRPDGRARRVASAPVPGYPMRVTVQMNEDEVLVPWRERRDQAVVIGATSIVLMLALIGLLWRHLTQLQAAQATLEEQNTALRMLNDELQQQAVVDALTGLHNRRYFNVEFPREILRARRSHSLLVFCIGDMDHFKKFNDRYGHPEGDLALQQVARVLGTSLQRATDFAFRLGGEEFAMLYTVHSVEEAWQIVESTRQRIEQLGLPHEENPGGVVTMSFGLVCVMPGAEVEPQSLYSQADTALYDAKAAGRSCSVRQIIRPPGRLAEA